MASEENNKCSNLKWASQCSGLNLIEMLWHEFTADHPGFSKNSNKFFYRGMVQKNHPIVVHVWSASTGNIELTFLLPNKAKPGNTKDSLGFSSLSSEWGKCVALVSADFVYSCNVDEGLNTFYDRFFQKVNKTERVPSLCISP